MEPKQKIIKKQVSGGDKVLNVLIPILFFALVLLTFFVLKGILGIDPGNLTINY